MLVRKIISGGQTGADRAALDWAIARGVPHGGSCPKGRRAEDGSIPSCYALTELNTANYLARTERNVIDSDGTVIVSAAAVLSSGSKRTAEFARRHQKPLLHVHAGTEDAGASLREFVAANRIATLNVAGPRLSGAPEIAVLVWQVLDSAFA